MIQTMTRSKVQNVMKPDFEQTCLRREMEYAKLPRTNDHEVAQAE